MRFSTSLPERKILGFTVVNYTFRAVFNVFFMSLLMAGFGVMTAANFVDFPAAAGLMAWLALTLAAFMMTMKFRDRAVRREIEEGRHDPLWGKHICRQMERETEAAYEKDWLMRPIFRLACLLGVYKKQ